MRLEPGERYLPVCGECHAGTLKDVYSPGIMMCETCNWIGLAPSAQDVARKKAYADLLGANDPFTAVVWMKTLPGRWQDEVEDAIVDVYHNT